MCFGKENPINRNLPYPIAQVLLQFVIKVCRDILVGFFRDKIINNHIIKENFEEQGDSINKEINRNRDFGESFLNNFHFKNKKLGEFIPTEDKIAQFREKTKDDFLNRFNNPENKMTNDERSKKQRSFEISLKADMDKFKNISVKQLEEYNKTNGKHKKNK